MPIYPRTNNNEIDPDHSIGLEGGQIEEVVKDLKEEINDNRQEIETGSLRHPDDILGFIEALDKNLT